MPKPSIQVLLVEDSASHAAMIRDALHAAGGRFQVIAADSLAAARGQLSVSRPDVAIVDFMLPDGQGTELLPESVAAAEFPFILMTGQGDERLAVRAMKSGALDYVVKSAAALDALPQLVERVLREWGHIVERRQAERAMRKSEARFRSIFESAASGMAFLTPEGRVLRANPVFCRISGYTAEEILQLSVLEVTHPDFRDLTRRIYRDIASGRRKVAHYEKAYLTKGGIVVWGHVTLTQVQDPDSAEPYVVAIVHDITERKRVEDSLRRTNRELDTFVATVAHDLRTPLTPIIGYADFLAGSYEQVLDQEGLACLARIRGQGLRMLAILEDLLALSRVAAPESSARPVSAGSVVRQVLADLAAPLRERQVTVEVGELPEAAVSESLLGQVFANLIGNALNYGCREGGKIEVGGLREGRRVGFRVSDHGPGIPAPERERVFDIFFRGPESQAQTGSGLGLAIVRKIARHYGGRAWCEETPGGGATFWVEFNLPVPPPG